VERVKDRHVVIVVFPGFQPLDAVGPFEVFSGANRAAGALGRAGGYRVTLASVDGSPVTSESGLSLGTTTLPGPAERIDTLLLSGGGGTRAARHDVELIDWVRDRSTRARRVATVCTGAFLAAEAGRLDGRRVTTHWAAAAELQADYPSLQVDADPIYIKDGKYWTAPA